MLTKRILAPPYWWQIKARKTGFLLNLSHQINPQLHSPNWIISPDYAFNDWKSCWYLSRHHNGPIILFYIHGLVQNELLGKCFRKGHRCSKPLYANMGRFCGQWHYCTCNSKSVENCSIYLTHDLIKLFVTDDWINLITLKQGSSITEHNFFQIL